MPAGEPVRSTVNRRVTIASEMDSHLLLYIASPQAVGDGLASSHCQSVFGWSAANGHLRRDTPFLEGTSGTVGAFSASGPPPTSLVSTPNPSGCDRVRRDAVTVQVVERADSG